MNETEERILECVNYLFQKIDAEGETNPEDQRLFDFLTYVQDGKQKPF